MHQNLSLIIKTIYTRYKARQTIRFIIKTCLYYPFTLKDKSLSLIVIAVATLLNWIYQTWQDKISYTYCIFSRWHWFNNVVKVWSSVYQKYPIKEQKFKVYYSPICRKDGFKTFLAPASGWLCVSFQSDSTTVWKLSNPYGVDWYRETPIIVQAHATRTLGQQMSPDCLLTHEHQLIGVNTRLEL